MLGSSRVNPMKIDGGIEDVLRNLERLRLDALVAIGGDDTLSVAARLAETTGAGGRCAQDDGQRPEHHRLLHRIRQRGERGHRGARPPAHHGDLASPRDGLRGHGARHRMGRGDGRSRRRRRHDHHSRVRGHRGRGRRASRGAHADRGQRLQHHRRRRGRRDGGAADQGRGGGRARCVRPRAARAGAASARHWRASSRSGPDTRRAPRCSVTCSAAARRPRTTGSGRRVSAPRRTTSSSRAVSARCRWCRGGTVDVARIADVVAEQRRVPRELYELAQVFY